jgi:hypothetical protein
MKSVARVAQATAVAVLAGILAACGGADPSRDDLPQDIVDARPTISVEEAKFVLAARELGVDVTGASVGEDLETAKTVCWALKEGGLQVREIAAELTQDDALRTKRIIKAGIESLCPDYTDQVGQLELPE